MPSIYAVAPQNLEQMRQQVLQRFAALLESHTHTNQFASNVSALTHDVNAEIAEGLKSCVHLLEGSVIDQQVREEMLDCLSAEISRLNRLDTTLAMLLAERQRQWERNGRDLEQNMLDFSYTVDNLAGTLIEKDLLERQSQVLEKIIISHERVSQWQTFVQQILASFHTIFPSISSLSRLLKNTVWPYICTLSEIARMK